MEKELQENFAGEKILVIGAGISGTAAALTAKKMGAEVVLSDSKTEDKITDDLTPLKEAGVELLLGPQTEEQLEGVTRVIASPAVPCRVPLIQAAYSKKIHVESEVELAYHLAASPLYAITGTNGKTTTVTLTGDLFAAKYGKDKTGVGGNIGTPLVDEALRIGADGALVAEISSYQLEATDDFHPRISAILNVTPDHLLRHGTMDVYQATKEKIFAQQTAEEGDFVVLNFDDELTKNSIARAKEKGINVCPFSTVDRLSAEKYAAVLKDDVLTIRDDGKEVQLVKTDELNIKGRHNVENALAAAAIAYFGGVDTEMIKKVLREFMPVEHRIEPVRELDGVRYYNDSKATNTDSTVKALESFTEPILLIAGGDDKMTDLTDFMQLVKAKCSKLVLVGAAAERFKSEALKGGIVQSDILEAGYDMAKAVELCRSEAKPGDVVLLSPACASFDMFTGFEHRGKVFKEIVNALK